MSRVLAIDPGNVESGYALIDADTRAPIKVDKVHNRDLLEMLEDNEFELSLIYDRGAIEMIASYGMAVGKEVFETCVWIGRFQQAAEIGMRLVYRCDVKLHHCHSAKAKDANIAQALIDRFASGEPNRGKGTKAAPGFFYGFRADIWQAYALAVLV
ncbi:MAG: hypothetical protein HOQ21_17425, partial [Dermatophilaceae bacterium]|nr:hypothetical protein [Dermatophilaceae bacterium]